MKIFYKALMSKFNALIAGANNEFYTAIGGRLFQEEAPEGTIYPYAVFKHINNNQIDTFKNKMDNIIIQFSIFSEKSSSTEIHDAMTHLKALFDDCRLSISNGSLIYFYRLNDGLQREKNEIVTESGIQRIWHFHCDYNVVFERS